MTNGGPDLEWAVETGDQSAVVRVAGEIDLMTQHQFDQAVSEALDTTAPVVNIDLGKVTFLGSIGLRVLIQAHSAAHQNGRTVRVVDASAAVHRTLTLTGLEQVLSIYPSVEAAQSRWPRES